MSSGDGGDAAGQPAVAIPSNVVLDELDRELERTRPPLCALRGRL